MRLLLVRHGQSEWNAVKRLQGQADIDLSPEGRAQAREIGPIVQQISPDYAIGSDLKRAISTAELMGFDHVQLSSKLREISVGDWTGQPIETLIEQSPDDYLNWRAGSFTPPHGESWTEFVSRTHGIIDEYRRHMDIRNLLVVCHGGVIRALLDHYLGLSPKSIIPVAPASLTSVRLPKSGESPARLELFNYRPTDLEFGAPD
ncbi:phosphoglycerate mutase (2,3-diphosphoglycerate-independent) [Maritalea myrionectae]|uniref:Phosphoglycerate mutase (2,3-diphosphoglycerate-independent) n=1 Tax=Maritalea myrionectae TaxID=454601 RepID=A0A2R4MGC1_9HYPH|nr:histidine phosphatase family protein [Maritalea myrionectae]AVX04929.1 phosphoglycerate mutase (2,3-diphosphoglycerate-independent) [Maritalea myrionectae]